MSRKIIVERDKVQKLIQENEDRKFTLDELFQLPDSQKSFKITPNFDALTHIFPGASANNTNIFSSPKTSINSIIPQVKFTLFMIYFSSKCSINTKIRSKTDHKSKRCFICKG